LLLLLLLLLLILFSLFLFLLSSIFDRSNLEFLFDTILPPADCIALHRTLATPTLSNPSGFRYGLALLNHLVTKCGVGCERVPSYRLVSFTADFPASPSVVSPSESLSTSLSLSQSVELEVPKSNVASSDSEGAKESSNHGAEAMTPCEGNGEEFASSEKACQCDSSCEPTLEKESNASAITDSLAIAAATTTPQPTAKQMPVSMPMTRVIFDADEHFDTQAARALYESHVPLETPLVPPIAILLLHRQADLMASLGVSTASILGERESATSSSLSSNGRRSRVSSSLTPSANRDNGANGASLNGQGKVFGFQRLLVLKCFEQLMELGTEEASLFFLKVNSYFFRSRRIFIGQFLFCCWKIGHSLGFDCIKKALSEQHDYYLSFLKLMFSFQENDFCDLLVSNIYSNTITFLTDKCDDFAITTFLDKTNIMAHLLFRENELKKSNGARGLNPFLKVSFRFFK
jgi:hypothetical protein